MRGTWVAAACVVSWATACASGADGADWRPVAALEAVGWGMNTSAVPGGDRFWVVGGTPDRGQILRESSDGEFVTESIPAVPLLNWIHFFEGGEGFAVGNGGTVLSRRGDAWEQQEVPTQQDLWGVWGAQPNDVWAVGGAGRSAGQATLLHYDGRAWSEVALPDLQRPNVWALFKVWGTAADDVWVVGQRGAILHYDGDGWSEDGAGTSEDLIALWGTGPDRMMAVGGRSSAVVARYDGERWQSDSLAPLPALNGVWTGDGATVHVGGVDGTLARIDFDSLDVDEDYQDSRATFHSVFGTGGRLLAVGGNLTATGPPYQGLAREGVDR